MLLLVPRLVLVPRRRLLQLLDQPGHAWQLASAPVSEPAFISSVIVVLPP
jgi:hypothetical protein